MGELLALHARELSKFLLPLVARDPAHADPTIARGLAEEAALYALAAFDPQDAIDVMQIRALLTTTYCAMDGRSTEALIRKMQATAAMVLRSLEARQVQMRMRDAPAIPGRRRKTPRQLEAPPAVPLPEGVTHWLELITDPALRGRLAVP
jgi:hypothetical protein